MFQQGKFFFSHTDFFSENTLFCLGSSTSLIVCIIPFFRHLLSIAHKILTLLTVFCVSISALFSHGEFIYQFKRHAADVQLHAPPPLPNIALPTPSFWSRGDLSACVILVPINVVHWSKKGGGNSYIHHVLCLPWQSHDSQRCLQSLQIEGGAVLCNPVFPALITPLICQVVFKCAVCTTVFSEKYFYGTRL